MRRAPLPPSPTLAQPGTSALAPSAASPFKTKRRSAESSPVFADGRLVSVPIIKSSFGLFEKLFWGRDAWSAVRDAGVKARRGPRGKREGPRKEGVARYSLLVTRVVAR